MSIRNGDDDDDDELQFLEPRHGSRLKRAINLKSLYVCHWYCMFLPWQLLSKRLGDVVCVSHLFRLTIQWTLYLCRQTLGGHINMSESLKQKLKMNNISFSVKPTCISKIKAQDLDKIIVENISYGQRRTSLNQIVIFILCILLPIFFSFYPSAN